MKAFQIAELIDEASKSNQTYVEFLRLPALSCGLYFLPADGRDMQEPHTEDEVYYVVEGRASIRVGGEEQDQPVRPGSLVLVEAGVPHKFHDIVEDLKVLVLFAPAEYSKVAKRG